MVSRAWLKNLFSAFLIILGFQQLFLFFRPLMNIYHHLSLLWPLFFYDYLDIFSFCFAICLIFSGFILLLIETIEEDIYKLSLALCAGFFFLRSLYYIYSLISIIILSTFEPALLYSFDTIIVIFIACINACLGISALYLIFLTWKKVPTQDIIRFFLNIFFLTKTIEGVLGIISSIIGAIFLTIQVMFSTLFFLFLVFGTQVAYSGLGIKQMIKLKENPPVDLANDFNPIILALFASNFFLVKVLNASAVLDILSWVLNWSITIILACLTLLLFLFQRKKPE